MADRPDPRLSDAAERFDGCVDALLGDGRPSPEAVGDREEAEMARAAAELAGARPGLGSAPDAAFMEQLRLRMREADAGIATIQAPPPVREHPAPEGLATWRLTRRQVLQVGIGAAAGMAAGVIGVTLRNGGNAAPAGIGDHQPLVTGAGFWTEVARVVDVPIGAAVRFSTAAFDGFVVNQAGTIRALSSVCTHMACTLHYRPDWQDLRCPCHGASFDLGGRLANGRTTWRSEGAYPGDARAYPLDLPDLVRPEVKLEGGSVWVWTAQA